MSNVRDAIAKNIKSLREASGLTQKDLADRLNVTKAAVNNWESGANSPEIDTLMKICRIFNVSASAIAGVSEDEESEARRFYMAYRRAPDDIRNAVEILLKVVIEEGARRGSGGKT